MLFVFKMTVTYVLLQKRSHPRLSFEKLNLQRIDVLSITLQGLCGELLELFSPSAPHNMTDSLPAVGCGEDSGGMRRQHAQTR